MTKISFNLTTVSDIDAAIHQLGFLRKAFEVIAPTAQAWSVAQPAAAPLAPDYVEAETVTVAVADPTSQDLITKVLEELIGGKFALRTLDGLADKFPMWDEGDVEEVLDELISQGKVRTKHRRADGVTLYGAVGRI